MKFPMARGYRRSTMFRTVFFASTALFSQRKVFRSYMFRTGGPFELLGPVFQSTMFRSDQILIYWLNICAGGNIILIRYPFLWMRKNELSKNFRKTKKTAGFRQSTKKKVRGRGVQNELPGVRYIYIYNPNVFHGFLLFASRLSTTFHNDFPQWQQWHLNYFPLSAGRKEPAWAQARLCQSWLYGRHIDRYLKITYLATFLESKCESPPNKKRRKYHTVEYYGPVRRKFWWWSVNGKRRKEMPEMVNAPPYEIPLQSSQLRPHCVQTSFSKCYKISVCIGRRDEN